MIRPLYKACEPFMEVKNGYGYLGVVMYDDDTDKVQCHICGQWFSAVGMHVKSAHKIELDTYKMNHGLSLRTSLCSKKLSRAHSKSALSLYAGKASKLTRGTPGRRRHSPKPPKRYYMQTIQAKNARGLCDLQVQGRYDVLKKMVNREPTYGDYQRHDRKLWATMVARYGTINKFREYIGGTQMNNSQWRELPNTTLIAALRAFSSKFSRIPRSQDFQSRRPNTATFYRHFGSWSNALRMAGIK